MENLMNNIDLIQKVERLCYNTWPAELQQPLGDWHLRASKGFTKRANSIWTSTDTIPKDPLWFHNASSFYNEQSLPLRFHISDASDPMLSTLLDQKSFKREAPSSVLTSTTRQVIQSTKPIQPLCKVKISKQHDAAWLTHFLDMEGHGQDTPTRSFYHRTFTDITPAKGFLSLYVKDVPVAMGTTVAEDGWAGFLNVVVHPSYRGQGLGRELVHHLALHSGTLGASMLYLQVVDENESAIRLYRKACFSPLYRYHYRCQQAEARLDD